MTSSEGSDPGPAGPSSLESTATLLALARAGEGPARERLFARFLPVLRRWAHHRLPPGARDLAETDDLVQVTLMRALGRLDSFEHRGEGAFLAYLREILVNASRDEMRRAVRKKNTRSLDEGPVEEPAAVERAVGPETLARYELGLSRLSPEQREAVILRLEMGYSHAEIAEALGKPSADAARMMVARSIATLAECMRDSF
jgi:RNA polymerase sigma factor (sigma-70 family)